MSLELNSYDLFEEIKKLKPRTKIRASIVVENIPRVKIKYSKKFWASMANYCLFHFLFSYRLPSFLLTSLSSRYHVLRPSKNRSFDLNPLPKSFLKSRKKRREKGPNPTKKRVQSCSEISFTSTKNKATNRICINSWNFRQW